MSEPTVKDLINFTFSQTDIPTFGLENSLRICENSNLDHIDLNKTFDLNKCNEHIPTSGGIIDPFNKYSLNCTVQKEDAPTKLSQRESLDRLESDESLGIIPDLLKDEMTFDLFKAESGFSDDEIQDNYSEINKNPASLVFSPPSDNQFNRISLFLKNISTPLPNFGNDRRCSSTPKISVTRQFVANTADIEHYSSPHFLPDEKEEPIAGSCHIKFETDFNLDDFKNVKPLTSTHKMFSPPRLSSILNELDEEADLKSKINLKQKHETFENNLNVTQTFSHDFEDLFACVHKDNVPNVDILNNTFQIKQPVFVESADAVGSLKCSVPSTMQLKQTASNNGSENEKIKTLDSTFAIPRNEISFNVDCKKTFLIDVNSTISTELPSKSFSKDKHTSFIQHLEMDPVAFSSKQQDQIANVTFTKDLENDAQTSFEHCFSSHGSVFKPMTQILEETFSKNDLNPILEETFSKNDLDPILDETFSKNDLSKMLNHSKNYLQGVNSKNHSTSKACNINANATFSETIKILSGTKVPQNNSIEFASHDSPKILENNTFHEKTEINSFIHPINLDENNFSKNMSLSDALQSNKDATFSREPDENDQEIGKFHKSDSNDNSCIGEYVNPKALASTTFNEEVGGKSCIHDQINLAESDISQKILLPVVLQSIEDVSFSEEINERADQENDKLHKSNSTENVNSIVELASSKSPKSLASDIFNIEIGGNISNFKNEHDPTNKLSHSDPLQPISDNIFSGTIKKSEVVTVEFYKKDSVKNKSSHEMASLLQKVSKNLSFADESEVVNSLESNVFEELSDLTKRGASNLQDVFSKKSTSLNLNKGDNFHAVTHFPKVIQDGIFTGNALEEPEFCTRSISEEECPSEILPVSSDLSVSTELSEKNDGIQLDVDSVSNENNQAQLSPNSLKAITDINVSKKVSKVQVEEISIPTENDKFETSSNPQREVTSAPFSGLVDEDMKVDKSEVQTNHCDQDSLCETALNSTKSLKDTLFRKATDKFNLKSSSLGAKKTVVKNGLIKPSKIIYPRKVSEQHNGQLPIAKPIIDKRFSTSNLNRTLNLSDNPADKSYSKTLNRRLTLSCSSESDASKSKCRNEFKKPFGIPSKLGIKRPGSNFQKSKLDTKYSNGHIKDINVDDKQNSLPQPDAIPSKDLKMVKSDIAISVNKKGPISSRISFHGKLPLKSLKMREGGINSSSSLEYTAKKSNKVISCPKVIDQPIKEKMPEIDFNANPVKNSKHSIATNLPRKLLSFNNPNKTSNLKPTVTKQKSASVYNSSKPDSLSQLGSIKLPDSIAKLKISSLPKAQSCTKISPDGSENESGINKRPASESRKSNGFLMKPGIPNGEIVQLVETLSRDNVKQKDNARKNNQPTSKFPLSREQTGQSSNPLNVKKSNGQCNVLPMPKVIKSNIRSVNSNDVLPAQESQNQDCQKTSGKLPQLRRIPAPRYK